MSTHSDSKTSEPDPQLKPLRHSSSFGSPSSSSPSTLDHALTPLRSSYQPRPFLLSSLGTHPPPSHPSTHAHLLRSHHHTQSLLEQRHRERIHAEIVRESLLRRKRDQLAELSSLNDDQDDGWSWLSGSECESEDHQTSEDMAVVWRASLDVGRRVSRNRKALGKPYKPCSGTSSDAHLSSSKPSNDQAPKIRTSPLFRLLALINPLDHLHKLRSIIHHNYAGVVLFGSGMMGGVICSILSTVVGFLFFVFVLGLGFSTSGFETDPVWLSFSKSSSLHDGLISFQIHRSVSDSLHRSYHLIIM